MTASKEWSQAVFPSGGSIMKKSPPWKRKAPQTSTPQPLSAEQKRAAKARAEAAGRRYPNLVDNMWAARQKG